LADQQIPPRGVEPLEVNQQISENKALTEKVNSVLSTSLDKIVQACSELAESEFPELEQIITAWPELPEQIKNTIKALVQTQIKTGE
jgi:hypothetical protein